MKEFMAILIAISLLVTIIGISLIESSIITKSDILCSTHNYSEYHIEKYYNGWIYNGNYTVFCYNYSELYEISDDELKEFQFPGK